MEVGRKGKRGSILLEFIEDVIIGNLGYILGIGSGLIRLLSFL